MSDIDIVLGPGEHLLARTVVLKNLQNVRLRGQENDRGQLPTVRVAADVLIAFEIGDHVESLIIQDLHIVGSTPPAGKTLTTHAIGSHEGGRDVRFTTFQNLVIERVAVGISVGSCPDYRYLKVLIRNNTLSDILGDDSGSGYGIHAACASGVRIENNRLTRTGRHAIYIGRGGPAEIVNNQIDNHGVNAKPRPYWRSAITVARAQQVSLRDNQISNSHDVAVSVESDGLEDATQVCVQGLKVLQQPIGRPTLWVNVKPGTVVTLVKPPSVARQSDEVLVQSGRLVWQSKPCPIWVAEVP